MIDLKDQIVLVTGANRGIGAATARVLLNAGADVVAHYNTGPGKTDSLLEDFGADRVKPVQADFSSREGPDGLWRHAMDWKGRITGLVNNAAVMLSAKPEDDVKAWKADWDKTLAVNLTAVADLCRHAILHFKEGSGGAIVNVASRAGFRGDLADSMHYAASKGGVVALTRSIAKGYARDGIYAYCIAPGWVMTERVRPKLEAPENAFMLEEVPMKAAAPPEQVGNIIAFALSGLATHATGATIDINGASYFH